MNGENCAFDTCASICGHPHHPLAQCARDHRHDWQRLADPQPGTALDPATYKLELSGSIGDKRAWTLDQLYQLPRTSQITRHVCVEGWSRIGKWSGCPLRVFLERVAADLTAKYVGFICADGYYTSIDMPTALHPQTIMAFTFADEVLPRKFGYPMKIRIPTKLGFKNPKFVVALSVTNNYPGGFWEDYGYNWFGGS